MNGRVIESPNLLFYENSIPLAIGKVFPHEGGH
jgi:hypothetical protein